MKRSTHRSTADKKLYAVRDRSGRFKDIQTYERAHRTSAAADSTARAQANAARTSSLNKLSRAVRKAGVYDQPKRGRKPKSLGQIAYEASDYELIPTCGPWSKAPACVHICFEKIAAAVEAAVLKRTKPK